MAELTYFDYINSFFELLKVNPPSSNAQLLYHTLLMEYNNALWQSVELHRTNSYIGGLCNLGEKALTNAKNELKQLGLIDFTASKKKPTIYRLLPVKKTGQTEVKTQVKGKSKEDKTQLKGRSYKDIRYKTEDLRNITPISPAEGKTAEAKNFNDEDSKFSAVIAEYENNIAPMTGHIRESIIDWCKNIDSEIVIFAIHEAVENNKRNWRYIEAIIRSHYNAGRRTLKEVKQASADYRLKPKGKKDLGVYNSDVDYDALVEETQQKQWR